MDKSYQASGGYSHLSEFDFQNLNSTAPCPMNAPNYTSEELHAIFEEAKLTPEQLERFRKARKRLLRERKRDNEYQRLQQVIQQNSLQVTEGLKQLNIKSNPKPQTTSKSNPKPQSTSESNPCQNSVQNLHTQNGNEAAFLETAPCSMNLLGNADPTIGEFAYIHSSSPYKSNDINEALEEAKLTPEQLVRFKKAKQRKLRELERDLEYEMLKQEIKQDSTRCTEHLQRLREQSNLNQELLNGFNPTLAIQQPSLVSTVPQNINVTAEAAVGSTVTPTTAVGPESMTTTRSSKGKNLIIIKVVGFGQNAIFLPICPDTTIFRIKELLIKEIGVKPTQQVLYIDYDILPNDSTAEECGLTDGTEIGLMVEM